MFENPNRLAKMKIVDYKISGFRVPMKSTKNDPYMYLPQVLAPQMP